jgi:hypothetical protein
MTRDGVVGTAAKGRARSELRDWLRRPLFIKRDDGRLAPRYIEPAYPHTPAGGVTPNRLRRERQVASALRNRTDFTIRSFYCGTGGRAPADARPRVRPPRCPAKGSR